MSGLSSMPSDNGRSKGERIEERLESIVRSKPNAVCINDTGIFSLVSGIEDKQRIDSILRHVGELTDVQKLLLYIRLPTGTRSSDHHESPSNNRSEHAIALCWLRTHLQLDANTCLPKQDILDEYRLFCERHGYQVISQADFGKLVKQVFPDTKTRRLGQRGQSRHCYGGLGVRTCVDSPSLPDVDTVCLKEEQVSASSGEEENLVAASSSLVCEWAQKLLNRDVPDVVELARYLVTNSYVNGQSHAAFAVLATVDSSSDAALLKESVGVTGQAGSRTRDVHLQLQRKLQQRGQLRQQKKRLEEQRSRLSDGVMTDQQTDESHVKNDKREETVLLEKKEQTERLKESISNRAQQVLPKLILPKPASIVASSQEPNGVISRTISMPGEISPSVLLLTPPASTHPQPMLYLSPQQPNVLSSQQPIVVAPATMGEHRSVNAAPLTFGSVLVSSVPQQTNGVTSAIASTAGTGVRQCMQQPLRHQQLQQLLQQPSPQLLRQQAPTSTRALPRTDLKFTSRTQTDTRPNAYVTVPGNSVHASSMCHRQTGNSAVVTVRAPASNNQSTNVAANPCLAALIRASPTCSSISGPLTFQGGLHLHADLAPGGVHLHTDLAPGGSAVSGAYIDSHGMQNSAPPGVCGIEKLDETAVTPSVCMTNVMVAGTTAAQSHVLSPQHNTMQTEPCVGSPVSVGTPQKGIAKPGSTGKVLKTPAKTVSTLLKEQRGYGPQEDQRAPYVKDKRPVSELLKESRMKRQLSIGQPRLVVLDATQNGDRKQSSATTEPDVPFGNGGNDNSVIVVNLPRLARHEAAVKQRSQILVSDSPRQSNWSSGSGSTNCMIQLLRSKADESQGSSSWGSGSDGSVDMPAADRDNLLGCFSMDAVTDLADITPSINNVESCDIQSLSSGVASGGMIQMVNPGLQLGARESMQLSGQMKELFEMQTLDDTQQQRNSAVSFTDCLANNDTNMRRPQSESSIEHYRRDDLARIALPPGVVTSRPGSDISGSFADATGFQTQSSMNIPLKCGIPRSDTLANRVRIDQISFAAACEHNPTGSLMPSPQYTLSHDSSASMPLSVLSPKTHQRENVIGGCQSFTPISGSVDIEFRSFVSPVRPMATMGTVTHEHCLSVAGDPERTSLKQVTSDLDGSRGFLPYTATSTSVSAVEQSQMFPCLSDSVGATVPVMVYTQSSPYGLPQTYNNDEHFAPVSSIRPVKRGRCGSNATPAGPTKRARHHSAQSSFNVEVSSTPIEGGRRACVDHGQNFAVRQQQSVESAAFSPEIQLIMNSDGLLTSQTQTAYNLHRSRSVPAHHMVHDSRNDEGSCEFSAAALPDRSCSGSFMDDPSNEEITQLLQLKMDGKVGSARGLHMPQMHEYGARKNLTELLEGGVTHQEQQVYSSCRGDHMISGASWRPATLGFGDGARQRFRCATSYPEEDVALTPPSSQNPTPVDFGGVVVTVDQSQSRPCSRQECIAGGRTFAVATAMHTPSSMDVTGDGREPLDDQLFPGVYDNDSSATRGTADSVSPADQLVVDNQQMSLEWGLV